MALKLKGWYGINQRLLRNLMLTKWSIPVFWSYGAPGWVVKLPPSSAGPGLTHTPGFIAAHKDINLSTLVWCKKKMGSNADDENKNRGRLLSVSMLTSDGRVCHLARSTHIDVDTVVNGFQAVTATSTIIYSMVAECWPSMNSSQHIVRAWRDVVLRRSHNTGWKMPSGIFHAEIICKRTSWASQHRR